MKEKKLNGRCLYTPGGAAREYAAVGCNFYRGCPYQCRYCYNRRGLTAKVMGLDHAVLEDVFVKAERRPKKYRELTAEEYAYVCFQQEVFKWQDYLRKTGIFFSFSTDPLCDAAFDLTWLCVRHATKEYGIPVKILTKNADFSAFQMLQFDMTSPDQRSLIAFGYTLTGRDDWEPYASKNSDRVRMLRIFHDMGFKTFASIEPIVDFGSSLSMIKQSARFCDQFLIGLMSCRKANGLEPYTKDDGSRFVSNVDSFFLVFNDSRPDKHFTHIYWKESIRQLVMSRMFAKMVIDYSPESVSRDWSLFTKSEIKL